MVEIRIDTEDGETRKDVYEAMGTFLLQFILDETRAAYEHAYDQGWKEGHDAGMKEGYRDGHRDGMTEAVTTITE